MSDDEAKTENKRTTFHPKSTLQFNPQHHNSQWGHVDGNSSNLERY